MPTAADSVVSHVLNATQALAFFQEAYESEDAAAAAALREQADACLQAALIRSVACPRPASCGQGWTGVSVLVHPARCASRTPLPPATPRFPSVLTALADKCHAFLRPTISEHRHFRDPTSPTASERNVMLMTILYAERAHTLYAGEHVLDWMQVRQRVHSGRRWSAARDAMAHACVESPPFLRCRKTPWPCWRSWRPGSLSRNASPLRLGTAALATPARLPAFLAPKERLCSPPCPPPAVTFKAENALPSRSKERAAARSPPRAARGAGPAACRRHAPGHYGLRPPSPRQCSVSVFCAARVFVSFASAAVSTETANHVTRPSPLSRALLQVTVRRARARRTRGGAGQ